MLWFIVAVGAIHAFTFAMLEVVRPELRDPEYGKRIERLKQRIAEHPDRPLVVVLGSSRVAMGVRPQAWESAKQSRTDPILFNMARLGGGPLHELMTLRRIDAERVKPDVVAIEYWPPLLHEQGPFDEVDRLNAAHLYFADAPFLHAYHPRVQHIESEMWRSRANPIHEQRQRWLAFAAPSWVPDEKRVETGCRCMDAWGWVPGLDHDPVARPARLGHFEPIYRDHFAAYRISPNADRALRETVDLARANGSAVIILLMPESSEFLDWYPARAKQLAGEHLNGLCRELAVPLIDARHWLADEYLVDGIHLSPAGASRFTQRFGAAIGELGWHTPRTVR